MQTINVNSNLGPLQQQTYAALFAATNKLQTKGDGALEQLTSRQLMLMMAVPNLPPDETTIINLSKKMGASKQSTTQVVDILKRKGYLAAVKSPKDGRAVNISLTEEGTRVLEHEFQAGAQVFEQFFHNFSPAELTQFSEYLQRLYNYDEEHVEVPEESSNGELARQISMGERAQARIAKHARGKQGLVLTVGIAREGHKEFKVYGEDMRPKLYEERAHTYEIGSLTQTFTAGLLAKYISEGRLALEDGIDKFLPLPQGKHPSIRQLATHTAGYAQLLPLTLGKYAGKILRSDLYTANPYRENISREEMLTLAATKSAGGVDAPYAYSNFGFALLGTILGEISGRGWWETIQEYTEKELGLADTKPGSQAGLLPGYRGGKSCGNWLWEPEQYMASAVSLTVTPEDLLQYAILHMREARPHLALCHHKYAVKRQEQDVGLAWDITQGTGEISHEGSSGCFSAFVVFDKQKQTAVTIQSNYLFPNIAKLGRQIVQDL